MVVSTVWTVVLRNSSAYRGESVGVERSILKLHIVIAACMVVQSFIITCWFGIPIAVLDHRCVFCRNRQEQQSLVDTCTVSKGRRRLLLKCVELTRSFFQQAIH